MSSALLDLDRIRACEARLARALAPGMLMERAGASAARVIMDRYAPRKVLVICGPGNNGGDGYVCARHLRAAGVAVELIAPAAPASVDAKQAQARWHDGGGTTGTDLPSALTCDVLVDAMFGIGLRRPLEGSYLDAVHRIATLDAPVIALDLPSGLDGDRGSWVGGVAGVHADLTLTFLADKPGLHTGAGCDAVGELVVETLGASSATCAGRLNDPGEFAAILAPRRRNSHKGTYGNAAIVGGSTGMVGAALLAARAALRLGAGRVFVSCIGARDLAFDPTQPELMFRALEMLPAVSVCVAGCGLGDGDDSRSALAGLLLRPHALVLDADALNLLAQDAALRAALLRHAGPRVLTPHPLEAARLLGTDVHAVQSDRIASAARLASTLQSVTVLKGAGTVVALPAGRWWINPTGGPALSTAGTGDVLAGMIGALLAQGFAADVSALGAVWLHGRAADHFDSDVGLVASDLAEAAVREWRALRRSSA